ncbi:MAG: hypothetical protein IKA65_00025 [Lentisphaeria bacterium]|nr:hypothetical protein [Lentisphaeria bacterium]
MNTATFNDRLQLLFWACFSLLLGLGFIFYGFVVFGYLVAALPWILSVAGGLIFLSGILRKSRRGYFKIVLGAVIFCCGIALFRWPEWRDGVLWYIFTAYLAISAYINMRPAWRRGVEKHVFARYAGGLTVWGFAALLLFMPRSGLSDALQLLGFFAAAWGVYQLLLPPGRE